MFNRRTFVKTVLGLGLAPLATAGPAKRRGKRLIKPKRLVKGQTVALIAPASSTYENEDIYYAIDIIRSLGFKVKQGKNLFQRWGHLAGSDEQRADDINAMFADPSVSGIFTLRGGYGTPRLLPLIDYKMIAKNPKVLIGYSDITALLNAIQIKTGLVTFHGPIAYQNYSDYTLAEMKKVLMTPEAPIPIGIPPEFPTAEGRVDRLNRLTRIVPGKARGPLVGGNLSLICKLLGTPYEPDFKDKILFLEDVGEIPRRVDGMLAHLWLAGKLQEAAGIVIGKFTDAKPDNVSQSMEEMLTYRFQEIGKPTIKGMMIGHVADQTTLPLGIEAELDVAAGTLILQDSAVL